jgi:hypothetical protein
LLLVRVVVRFYVRVGPVVAAGKQVGEKYGDGKCDGVVEKSTVLGP